VYTHISLLNISWIQNVVKAKIGCGISHEKCKEVKSFAGTLKSKRRTILMLETSLGRKRVPIFQKITLMYLSSKP
jgi:hypothetical protein